MPASISESLFSLDSLDEEIDSLSDDSDSDAYSSAFSAASTSSNVSRLSFKREDEVENESLATQESKNLVKFRLFLVTILFWTTIGVGMYVWIYFTEEIETGFEEHFENEVQELCDELAHKFLVAFGAIDSFAIAISAKFSNWPFVTVPKFSKHADRLLELSNAIVVTNYYFVEKELRQEWETYSAANDFWVQDETHYQQSDIAAQNNIVLEGKPNTELANLNKNTSILPQWQQHPVGGSPYGWDGFQYKALANAWDIFQKENQAAVGYINNIPTSSDPDLNIEEKNTFISAFVRNSTHQKEPFMDIFYPIVNDFEEILEDRKSSSGDMNGNDTVGVVSVTFYWRDMLKSFLRDRIDGMHVVIENNCNQTFTYTWVDSELTYLGGEDLHEAEYEDRGKSFELPVRLGTNGCHYTIHTYPSSVMSTTFKEAEPSPGAFAGIAITIFIFTSMVFIFYDCLVERRQRKVYSSAVKNNAIVSSLFPKNVRDRLYKETSSNHPKSFQPAKTRLKSMIQVDDISNNANAVGNEADSPIADLFSNCTVLFADIVGFTSWSSERSPGQVFVLLENIYGAFDRIADRRGVFKVETIGDCYMAVTGLPNPQKDHAVIMARFARDCRDQLNALTRSLEVSLGPETSDLTMRFGLHSGPVTAGVLRGQKSRFQLFGDTVNTASRMESTGICNRIHISEETARLLMDAGKTSWLTPRSEAILAKGKGELTTYWLFEKHLSRRGSVCASTVASETSFASISSTMNTHIAKHVINDKRARLIDWNVDLFAGLIRKIVSRRQAQRSTRKLKEKSVQMSTRKIKEKDAQIGDSMSSDSYGMVLDEVVEIIELPAFCPKVVALQEDPHSIKLDIEVIVELRDYICEISNKYKRNAFHNFEHASHVTMSVAKLLSRIVAPDLETSSADFNSSLHDHTYGITSDPLTQFACILAALIHDVDHQGVPNTRLVEEEDSVAIKYKGRSVAEQNSVDIAWALFLEPQFSELRSAVCPTDNELNRLRQLVVNTVLATDILDKDLKQLRNQRWDKAFSSDRKDAIETNQDKINRKATIVLEHLIQASDVCHTMQHWHVYRKWNERLFEEMYVAYKIGRANADPSTFWYEGELGFFDHYIIPLSKKLSDCGVFGVSSDEYLNYALRNRKEWEQRGHTIVAEMVECLHAKNSEKPIFSNYSQH